MMGTDRLYAAGTTYSAYSPISFFPFTDPVGDDDWFDNTFYPQTDAFTAAFCIDGLLTGVQNLADFRGTLRVEQLTGSEVRVSGLTGAGNAYLCDARGRVIDSIRLRSDESIWHLDMAGHANGIYVVNAPGAGAARILNQP